MYNVKFDSNVDVCDDIFSFQTIEEAEEFIRTDLENYKEKFQDYDYANFCGDGKTEIWESGNDGYCSWERMWITEPKYEMKVYYGCDASKYGVSHSFRVADVEMIYGNIGKELAEELDMEPEDSDFDWDFITVSVPYETVQKIRADAIKEYQEALKNGRE